jgi:Tfp pilus assembly protein PilN
LTNMKTINLLPASQKKELELEFISHKILVFWIMVIASLILFVAVAWVFKFYQSQVIADNDKAIISTQQELAAPEYQDLHDQILSLNSAVSEIKNLNFHHYNWSQAMLRLSDLVTPNVEINELNFDATTGRIDIAGIGKTRDDVINFWANVVKSQDFAKINFPLTNLEKPTDATFNYTFYVNKDKFANPK